ncbi:MAG TPA: biopolymer transporter ExbD [Caldimonas sp.]|jgi:biopolymer transport protein ExbD|nr:biopolymer transporter ExbD [Caldimonas sp.]HEV7574584.1 biopolymer transporter ExbD [Caldimonas sp.]
MPARRLKKTQAHLEITAFINLIVVLVPFLLSVAVFTHLSVIDLSLPAQSNEQVQKLDPDKPLKLEVIIRAKYVEVNDKHGGRIIDPPIPNLASGPDTKTLSAAIQAIKLKFPQHDDASILAETEVPYDALVQVMDAVRAGHQVQGARVVSTDYFPNISVGDAPVIRQ